MITISAYNPSWPSEFDSIRIALADALGNLALRIDHIGSTSVPGLGAKDIIDIQISVRALTAEIPQRLVTAGFIYREDISVDHVPPGEDEDPVRWAKMLFKERAGERRANIHVRVDGNPNQRYALLFRDYLRAHPNAARTIELIKKQLARYHAEDVDACYDIKDPVYDLVWVAAQEWAEQTGWKPVDVELAVRQALLEKLNATISRLVATCREMNAPETTVYEGWSAKDILGHLTFWHESFARNAGDMVAGRKPAPLKGRYVELNRRSLEEFRNLTLEQVIERLLAAQHAIQQCILSPRLKLIPYRKGSRDYAPAEHLKIVDDHIRDHLKAIERSLKAAQ